jgi:hypothetical protein
LAAESGGDKRRRKRRQSASAVCFKAGIQNEAFYVWSSAGAAVDGNGADGGYGSFTGHPVAKRAERRL